MKKLRLLKGIMKRTGAGKLLIGYFSTILVVAALIVLVEPDIKSYGDGLWYTYTMGVTIGFGDFVATTVIGRILSIIVSLYTLLMVGMVPAIIVNYYMEIVKVRENKAIGANLDKLEHLTELSQEELAELSKKIKNMEKNFGKKK